MPNNDTSIAEKLIAYLVGPLFNVIGIALAIYIVYKIYKWRERVNAPVWAWEKYIKTLITDEEYEEVMRINAILNDKEYYDKIPTPKGYKVRKKQKLDLEDRFEEMTFVMRVSYVFTRKGNSGDKGFEVKEEKG